MKRVFSLTIVTAAIVALQSASAMDIIRTSINNHVDNKASAVATTDAGQLKKYYISADYGLVSMKPKAAGLIHNGFGDTTFPLNYDAPKTSAHSFSLGMGRQFNLSRHFDFRVGPEYDFMNVNYTGNSTLGNNPQTQTVNEYSYKDTTQAIMLSTQLLFRPFIHANLYLYAGVKAGYAINKIDNYSNVSTDGQASYTYDGGKKSGFAYGLDAGLEYNFYQTLGIHAGIEQMNFGNAPALSNGTITATAYGMTRSVDNLPVGKLTTQIVTVGLNYSF